MLCIPHCQVGLAYCHDTPKGIGSSRSKIAIKQNEQLHKKTEPLCVVALLFTTRPALSHTLRMSQLRQRHRLSFTCHFTPQPQRNWTLTKRLFQCSAAPICKNPFSSTLNLECKVSTNYNNYANIPQLLLRNVHYDGTWTIL
jgi:hypothetical protein